VAATLSPLRPVAPFWWKMPLHTLVLVANRTLIRTGQQPHHTQSSCNSTSIRSKHSTRMLTTYSQVTTVLAQCASCYYLHTHAPTASCRALVRVPTTLGGSSSSGTRAYRPKGTLSCWDSLSLPRLLPLSRPLAREEGARSNAPEDDNSHTVAGTDVHVDIDVGVGVGVGSKSSSWCTVKCEGGRHSGLGARQFRTSDTRVVATKSSSLAKQRKRTQRNAIG